jgi:hypothetical protein
MKSEDVMTAIVSASRVPPGHYGFRQAARMEWIKLRTLRSVKWALLVALAVMAQTGAGNPARAHLRELAGRYPAAGGVTLSPWAGLSIICGYAVVLLVAGGWLLSRRDA